MLTNQPAPTRAGPSEKKTMEQLPTRLSLGFSVPDITGLIESNQSDTS
jgi:hypothetical protein